MACFAYEKMFWQHSDNRKLYEENYMKFCFKTILLIIIQGWPNCGSSNICMRLFYAFRKIIYLFFIFYFYCKV